jgi:hypothetical protein
MSYEGYYQCLCKNGHYFEENVYDTHNNACPHCSSEVAWWNQVDTTNGSFYYDSAENQKERIDGFVELEVDKPPEICTCHCGHVHTKTVCAYKFPPQDVGHHGKLHNFEWDVE